MIIGSGSSSKFTAASKKDKFKKKNHFLIGKSAAAPSQV